MTPEELHHFDGDPSTLTAAARKFIKAGDAHAALPILDRCVEIADGKKLLRAHRLRVRASGMIGDHRSAASDALRALELDPEPDYSFVHSLVVRLRQLGEWVEATRILDSYRSSHQQLHDHIATWEDEGFSTTDRKLIIGVAEELPPEGDAEVAPKDASIPSTSAALTAADSRVVDSPGDVPARWHRLRTSLASDSPLAELSLNADIDLLIRRVDNPADALDLATALRRVDRHKDAAAMDAWAGTSSPAHEHTRRPDPSTAIDRPVVYTVLTGGYEAPQDASRVLANPEDFVILTDKPESLPESMRQFAQNLDVSGDAQLASRHPKILPHEYFPDHNASIYLDANFFLLKDPTELAQHLSLEEPMVVLDHSDRFNPASEMLAVIHPGFATFETVIAQVQRQRDAGFDPFAGPLSYGGFLVRDHRSDAVRSAMTTWWEYFESGIRRDQTSLNFALWSAGVTPRRLTMGNHRNEYWIRMRHA